MKTIQNFESEITTELSKLEQAKNDYHNREIEDSAYNKIVNKCSSVLNFLRMCKYYLETNPKPTFIKSEIERLENRVEKIEAGFQRYLKDSKVKDPVLAKKVYYAETDYKKIRKQLNTLTYIYSD